MGKLFLKILGSQESGYSGVTPDQRGKYILIPRSCIDYFPSLSEHRLNDFCVLRIDVPGPLQVGVRYHWHNAKYHPDPDHIRDHNERRIYRNKHFDEALDLDKKVIIGLFRKSDYEFVGISALPTDQEYASLVTIIKKNSLAPTSNTAIVDSGEIPSIAPRFHARLLSTDLAEIAAGEDPQALINEDELLKDSLPLITPLAADQDPLIQLSSMFCGQVDFSKAVREIYGSKCAVRRSGLIGGSTIGLEAAHVKARVEGGPYLPTNGMLLSADIHQAFDFGYWTLTNDWHIDVHENARIGELGRYHGEELSVPVNNVLRPFNAYIDWHRARVFGRFMAV